MKCGSDLREIHTIAISELKDTTCMLLLYTGNLMNVFEWFNCTGTRVVE